MKLSVTLVGRNDSYGGENYLNRVHYTIESLERSLDGVDFEVLFVDFNPLQGRESLHNIVKHYKHVKYFLFEPVVVDSIIKKHLNSGAKVVSGKEIFSYEKLSSIFSYFMCFNHFLERSSGEYVLATFIDNIFPIGFKNIVNSLSPNVLYRCRRKNIDINFIDSQFDNIMNGSPYLGAREQEDIKKDTLFHSAGDFLIADKSSWLEIGGFYPTCLSRMVDVDNHAVFRFMAYGKKIYSIHKSDYNFYNVNYPPSSGEKENYTITHNGISFDYKREVLENKEFLQYRKWAKEQKYDGRILYLGNRYKNRNEEIKRMFNRLLD